MDPGQDQPLVLDEGQDFAAHLVVGLVLVFCKSHETVLPAFERVEFGLVRFPLLDQRRVCPGGEDIRHMGRNGPRQGDLAFIVGVHAIAHAGVLSG
ncbi:hypothetical protein D3C87_1665810 [compost metagenome]